NETVNLVLTTPTGGATLGTPNTAVLTIADNDTPVIQFSAANFSVGEGDGKQDITVIRTGGTNVAVAVDFATTDGTASADADYMNTTGTVTFAEGDTNLTFTVDIVDDVE